MPQPATDGSGFVADREILEHIVCDFSDPQLMEKASSRLKLSVAI